MKFRHPCFFVQDVAHADEGYIALRRNQRPGAHSLWPVLGVAIIGRFWVATEDQIESVVVCRGFEQTGFMGHGVIPIIMESAFVDLVKGSPNLPSLRTTLRTRPDREETAAEATDVIRTIRVGGFEFVLPYLGRAEKDDERLT